LIAFALNLTTEESGEDLTTEDTVVTENIWFDI